jgi:hypothetical protein
MLSGSWDRRNGKSTLGTYTERTPTEKYWAIINSSSPSAPSFAYLTELLLLLSGWARQGSRVSNFFECYKNFITVTAIVADSRCHPN